jgi:hypothetical protein
MKQYSLLAVLSISTIVVAMAFVKKGNEQPDKHLEIVLRTIGHQMLLHSKDSTSRVLPVETVNENTFRISFEKSFGFTPDTLMNVVHQQLAKTDRSGDYTVTVNDCDQRHIIFAYEVNKANGDLKPCRGREQKAGCYAIEISFPGKRSFNYSWLLLAISAVALTAFYLLRKRNNADASLSTKTETGPSTAEVKNLGDFIFSGSTGILTLNGETIGLSVKEAKALSMLLSNLNEVVSRDALMKEIWEEEGLFVIARNVDVLISKLRKKLSADPSVKIANVHGKGYKLNVG